MSLGLKQVGAVPKDTLFLKRTLFLVLSSVQEGDLMLGDLAVLLGSVCCFERYWAQLIGTVPTDEESGLLPAMMDRVARLNPEATMRQLIQKCGVRWKAFVEVRQLRRQLTDIRKFRTHSCFQIRYNQYFDLEAFATIVTRTPIGVIKLLVMGLSISLRVSAGSNDNAQLVCHWPSRWCSP